MIDKTLSQYQILEKLGEGGMGEVFRVRDSRLQRDVAVKILPERFAGDRDALARFEREAQAVARLSHPNILEIHDFGVEGTTAYAVMELLEGEDLRHRIARSPFAWKEAVEIAASVAEGLAAAHGKGVVHRDLRPANVFLTKDCRVKILDFGLAKLSLPEAMAAPGSDTPTVSAPTAPGTIMGTVGIHVPRTGSW